MKKYLFVASLFILVVVAGIALRFYAYGGSARSQSAAVAFSSDSVFSEVPNSAPLAASSRDASDVPPPLSETTPQTQQLTGGKRTYKNTAFHFDLVFPDNLRATEYGEQDGALTVSFQDPGTNEGFEVYVTPYSGTQITSQRFRTDEPSGVMQRPTDLLVDGTRATMFFGKNAIMGDTREVWFIHGDIFTRLRHTKSSIHGLPHNADVEIYLELFRT